MEVYISANAFWALLISAVEVYKRECYGLLLGYRDSRNVYIVEHAVSYQTARRRHTSVDKNPRAWKRIHEFLANLPHLALIGDFHSHTGWGELKGRGTPSRTDVEDMVADEVYVIIVVNDKQRSTRWKYHKNGALSGSIDNYHFHIGAYYLDSSRRSRRASIFCPYAIGFHAKHRETTVVQSGLPVPRWSKSRG